MAQHWSQLWLPSRPGSRPSTRMLPCWSTLDIIAAPLPNVIPTPGPFLVRASRQLYENMAYRWWISWTIFASLLQCNSRRERRPLTTTPRFPSSVPPSRLANGSRDTNLAFTLFSSSTSESDGQLSRPQPVLRCGILCSPVFSMCSFPSISPPVSLIRYGRVGTAGLALFRSLTVPLLGPVPSHCRCLTLPALSAWFLWLLVVMCGTGWASTSLDNL